MSTCVSSFLSTMPMLGCSGFLWSFWDSLHSCLPAMLEGLSCALGPRAPSVTPAAIYFLFSPAFSTSKRSTSSSNNWSNWLVTMQPKPACKCPGIMVAQRHIPPWVATGYAKPRSPASALPTRSIFYVPSNFLTQCFMIFIIKFFYFFN